MSTPTERKRKVSVRKLSSTPKGGRQLKQQQISDLLKSGQEFHKESSEGGKLADGVSNNKPSKHQASQDMYQGGKGMNKNVKVKAPSVQD